MVGLFLKIKNEGIRHSMDSFAAKAVIVRLKLSLFDMFCIPIPNLCRLVGFA